MEIFDIANIHHSRAASKSQTLAPERLPGHNTADSRTSA
jgi:hypothetical protein